MGLVGALPITRTVVVERRYKPVTGTWTVGSPVPPTTSQSVASETMSVTVGVFEIQCDMKRARSGETVAWS